MSASIQAPAIAIAIPVYPENNIVDEDTKFSSSLVGYWVGIINLKSLNGILNDLQLDHNDQIILIDNNGNELINSKNWNNTNFIMSTLANSTTLSDQGRMDSTTSNDQLTTFENIEDIELGEKNDNLPKSKLINDNKYLMIYKPMKINILDLILVLISKLA